MIVWIKEWKDILTLSKAKLYIKEDVPVRVFISLDEVYCEDIIIISNQDDIFTTCKSAFAPFTVYVYEDIVKKIINNVAAEFQYNYNYYYLKVALSNAKKNNIDTIISGSSYGVFGIDSNISNNVVNLSSISQDLYYSLKGIYKVCEENKTIRNIVLCCNYYWFYTDLSKVQSIFELSRISQVFEPIYKDVHNCMFMPAHKKVLLQSNIFDMSKILEIYSEEKCEKHFFNNVKLRKKEAVFLWKDVKKEWYQLSEEEKNECGKIRAESHNALIKWELTYVENAVLMEELIHFCKEKDINLCIVVTPATKSYRENFLELFKDKFYELLNGIEEGEVHLLDLFDDDCYVDEDFIDTDHLSDSGAKKMTMAVLDMLQTIN